MEVEEKIVSLEELMGQFEKTTFEYSQILSELSDIKEKNKKIFNIKKNNTINKNGKKYIKYILNDNNVHNILKRKYNQNNKKNKNNSSIDLSTKLNSDDEENSN